jgi:hypothetical protein
MPSEVVESYSRDNDGHVKVTIELNSRGGRHGRTVTHTEEFTGLNFLRAHEHVAIAIQECVFCVFGEDGEAESRLVFGHLKRHPEVRKSVVVWEGEVVPKGAMLVSHTGEVLNDDSGMY